MEKLIYRFRFIVLIAILLLGFWLRHNDYLTWPRLGATFDEYAWTWLGMNIIQNHVPVSWSPHPQYSNAKDIIYQQTHFRLVKPYLEHPPLFGLVAGEWAILNGAKDMYHVSLVSIRGLALLLGVLSIFMVYLLASEVYDFKIGLLSSLIYAVTPTVVIGSRIVENENFFIPLFLLALFLVARYLKTGGKWLYITSAILCGLLTLAKVPWATAAVAMVGIFFYLKRYKEGLGFLAIVLPIFGLFFAWGYFWDWKLFVSLWQLQLNRYDIAFNSIFALFTTPYLVDRLMIDGWIYFGWVAVFLLMAKDFRKNIWVLIPFIAYFAVFVYAIPNEPDHGWYRYPFYPFMAIATALFIKEYFNKNYLLTFIFLIFTGLSMLQLSWAQTLGFSYGIFRFFLALFGVSALPLFIPKTQKLARFTSYASLGVILLLNIWAIFNYNEQ